MELDVLISNVAQAGSGSELGIAARAAWNDSRVSITQMCRERVCYKVMHTCDQMRTHTYWYT